jgi:hypothetical protein
MGNNGHALKSGGFNGNIWDINMEKMVINGKYMMYERYPLVI